MDEATRKASPDGPLTVSRCRRCGALRDGRRFGAACGDSIHQFIVIEPHPSCPGCSGAPDHIAWSDGRRIRCERNPR